MKLLLAIDIRRDNAEAVVDAGARWAASLDATLDLAWVDRFGKWRPFTLDKKLARQLEDEVERERRLDRERLELLRLRIPEARRGDAHTLVGDPLQVIPQAAKGYDALVLGPGERPGDQIGVGSVEARLVRYAPAAVLVLPDV